MHRLAFRLLLSGLLLVTAMVHGHIASALAAPSTCQTFPETGKQVCNQFLTYWQANGGLAQQGLPLSDAFDETNPTNGQVYLTQYFERARFEYHPEYAGTDGEVLLGLLGREQLLAKYPGGRPAVPTTGANCFAQTGHCVDDRFFAYWQAHGGLAQQGLPLSESFDEVNPTDGKTYRTQYFERARFEYHPEVAEPTSQVLLGLLGREQLLARYPGIPLGGVPPTPRMYSNPLRPASPTGTVTSCPDPTIIRGGDGLWYMYCTTEPLNDVDKRAGTEHNLVILRSTDLVAWTYLGDVFATTPGWIVPGTPLWAPDIHVFEGRYYLYYAAPYTAFPGGGSAIGVATAPSPAGPWVDSGAPVVAPEDAPCCPGQRRAAIDPAVVTDDTGQRYLFFGSFFGGIAARPLSADGLHADASREVAITHQDRYEGAFVIRHGGYYYLFVSAGDCCTSGSQTGYSVFAGRAKTALGPYTDRDGASLLDATVGGTPVLAPNGNRWVGTGHNAVFSDLAGQDWFLYHAVDRTDPYFQGTRDWNRRPVLLDPLDWSDDGWPTVNGGRGASDTPQVAPAALPGLPGRTPRPALADDQPGAPIAGTTDEFGGPGLGAQWGWIRAPASGGYSLADGALRLATSDTDLHLYPGGPPALAPILVQGAPTGDFMVETRLRLDVPSEGEGYNYAQAGLVVYGDDENYLKLATVAIWGTRQVEFAKQVTVPPGYPNYGSAFAGPPAAPGGWTWLRIAAHHDQGTSEGRYTAYTSRDGVHWTRGATWTHTLGPGARIGLVAMGRPGFTATIDYVRVAALRTP